MFENLDFEKHHVKNSRNFIILLDFKNIKNDHTYQL